MASWQPPDLLLVGCVKTKRRVRSVAKDLYSSPMWRSCIAFAAPSTSGRACDFCVRFR